MLFKSFTWQQFLVAALVLSSIWYLGVLPLLYRRQFSLWLDRKRKRPAVEPLRNAWDEELEEAVGVEDGVIGRTKLPEGMSRVDSLGFGFVGDVDEDARELQQGVVPDVIQELKSIFRIIEREQGTKEHFFSLFALVKAKYGAVRDTPSQAALNEYIREHALFPISDDELMNLWN